MEGCRPARPQEPLLHLERTLLHSNRAQQDGAGCALYNNTGTIQVSCTAANHTQLGLQRGCVVRTGLSIRQPWLYFSCLLIMGGTPLHLRPCTKALL